MLQKRTSRIIIQARDICCEYYHALIHCRSCVSDRRAKAYKQNFNYLKKKKWVRMLITLVVKKCEKKFYCRYFKFIFKFASYECKDTFFKRLWEHREISLAIEPMS